MMTETIIIAPFTADLEAYLKNTNMDYERADENKLFIYTSDYIAPDHKAVDPLIAELVKYINEDCIIEGYYDHGGNSGSTMKFRFEYLNGNLKKYLSDWLDFLPVDNFEDYEEFCEEYEDRFSEEEYEAFLEEDVVYLLDGGDGDAVTEEQIPITEYPLSI